MDLTFLQKRRYSSSMDKIFYVFVIILHTLEQTVSQNQIPLDTLEQTVSQNQIPLGSLFTTLAPLPLPRETVRCPSFSARYENDNLVIAIVPGRCDMVVGVQDMTHLFPGLQGALQIPGNMFRRIYLPTVTFRQPVNATINGMDCPMYPLKYLGPRVVIDTRPGQCQIVIGIRTFPVLPTNLPNNTASAQPFPVRARYVTRAVFERTFGLL